MQNKKPVILYDGICNLCNGTVDFLLKHDSKQQFHFVALQSAEGKKLLEYFQVPADINSVLLIKSNKVFFESDAIIEITKHLNFPWNMAMIGRIFPKKIRNGIYRLIAKNRYRWFGKRTTCRIYPDKKTN